MDFPDGSVLDYLMASQVFSDHSNENGRLEAEIAGAPNSHMAPTRMPWSMGGIPWRNIQKIQEEIQALDMILKFKKFNIGEESLYIAKRISLEGIY